MWVTVIIARVFVLVLALVPVACAKIWNERKDAKVFKLPVLCQLDFLFTYHVHHQWNISTVEFSVDHHEPHDSCAIRINRITLLWLNVFQLSRSVILACHLMWSINISYRFVFTLFAAPEKYFISFMFSHSLSLGLRFLHFMWNLCINE